MFVSTLKDSFSLHLMPRKLMCSAGWRSLGFRFYSCRNPRLSHAGVFTSKNPVVSGLNVKHPGQGSCV